MKHYRAIEYIYRACIDKRMRARTHTRTHTHTRARARTHTLDALHVHAGGLPDLHQVLAHHLRDARPSMSTQIIRIPECPGSLLMDPTRYFPATFERTGGCLRQGRYPSVHKGGGGALGNPQAGTCAGQKSPARDIKRAPSVREGGAATDTTRAPKEGI